MKGRLVWVILLTTLVACQNSEKIYLLPERTEIIAALTTKATTDEALSLAGWDDNDIFLQNYASSGLLKATAADTFPNNFDILKFGRFINQVYDTVIAIDLGWDSALVELRYKIHGSFKVVKCNVTTDTTGQTIYTPVDSSTKSFNITTRQKAIFLRTQNTNDAMRDWQLALVTPLVIEGSNTFSISQIYLSISGNPSSLKIPPSVGGEPLTYYFNRSALPTINYNSNINASVTINNTNPVTIAPGELVLLHLGRGANIYKKRVALSDSDNNAVHTGILSVNSHGSQIYRLFVDLIDLRTVLIKDAAYNSSVIMLPVRIP